VSAVSKEDRKKKTQQRSQSQREKKRNPRAPAMGEDKVPFSLVMGKGWRGELNIVYEGGWFPFQIQKIKEEERGGGGEGNRFLSSSRKKGSTNRKRRGSRDFLSQERD